MPNLKQFLLKMWKRFCSDGQLDTTDFRLSVSLYVVTLPYQIKINISRYWHDNGSKYKSNLMIKFGKNLINFMFAMLSPHLTVFGSARPGQDL